MRPILPHRVGPKVLLVVFILSSLIYLSTLGDYGFSNRILKGQRHFEPEEKNRHRIAREQENGLRQRPIIDKSSELKHAEEEQEISGYAAISTTAKASGSGTTHTSSGTSSATEKHGGSSSTTALGSSTAAEDSNDINLLAARPTSTFSAGTTSRVSTSARFVVADDYVPHFQEIIHLQNLTITEAASTCTWDPEAPVNFQYSSSSDWVAHERNATEIAHHRAEWQDYILHSMIPYSRVSHNLSEKGIVICAGNERSLKRLHVLLRLLTHYHTTLPIEIHHWTDKEISSANRTTLTAAYSNVRFNDLSLENQIYPTTADGFINYNLKLAAVLNSAFAEILLLDSDNLPLSDPSTLFTSQTYTKHRTVFWPDIARTRPQNPIWSLTNTHCKMDEYEQESGQLLVDKRRFWYHLQLAAWFGHQEYYAAFLLGDKDCFRFAWHALKTEYGRPRRWLASVGVVQRPMGEVAFPEDVTWEDSMADDLGGDEKRRAHGGSHSTYCGHSFGQHFPDSADSPIAFLHGGLVKTLNWQQIQHARNYSGGFFSAYKRSPRADSDMTAVEEVGIKYDDGREYLSDEVLGFTFGGEEEESGERKQGLDTAAHCVDMSRVVPGILGKEGTAELRSFEEVFGRVGGFWMVDDG